jgi:hypothetical protein
MTTRICCKRGRTVDTPKDELDLPTAVEDGSDYENHDEEGILEIIKQTS